jgi:kynurenine formamidase
VGNARLVGYKLVSTIQEVAALGKKIGIVALASLITTNALAQSDAEFIETVLSTRVIELNFLWDKNPPVLGFNPPFTLGLHSSHSGTKGMIPGGIAFAAEMMFFSGQHGAPTIDALGHISKDGKLYGGADAELSEGTAGLTALGIETYPSEKFVNRGVLLDVARYKGVEVLEPGYEITVADLEGTAEAGGVSVRAGDSVLIRTGFGRYYDGNRPMYEGPRPGPGEAAARWLADKDIFLTGTDQMSYEVVSADGSVFPAHRILIAESGIYLVENLNLEELATALADRDAAAFVLVVNPLRIKGATGMALNAFALLP